MVLKYIFPLLLALAAQSALAAPRMISYGYRNCMSCHVSPQGGGILTEYGNAVDESQSFRAGEYHEFSSTLNHIFATKKRMSQSLRLNPQVQNFTEYRPEYSALLQYRNELYLGEKSRISTTVEAAAFKNSTQQDRVRVPRINYAYQPTRNFELSLGRDYLPRGIYNSNYDQYVYADNRQGASDYKNQLKAISWGKSYLASVYAFGPSGDEPRAVQEYGGGALGEIYLTNSFVLGAQANVAQSELYARQSYSLFTRLGFSKSAGLLGEVALGQFDAKAAKVKSFAQLSSSLQLYLTPFNEWLLFTVTGQSGDIDGVTRQHKYKLTPAISARWSRTLTTSISFTHTDLGRKESQSFGFQIIMKD